MKTWTILLALAIASTARAEPSKVDDAKLTAMKYAFEAYPSWAAAHPEKYCPAKIEDLNEYMTKTDIKDPWGHAYRMACGKDMPAGAKGVAISSAGPDGKFGTADDIKSWD